ncbi:MAG: hypothetical protein RL564_493 [Pseudomonadota bacterium]|jgi:hypothetical protein
MLAIKSTLRQSTAIALFLVSAAATAQQLPEFTNFRSGDRVKYFLKNNIKSESFEYQINEVDGSARKGTVVRGGRSTEFLTSKNGYLEKEFCFVQLHVCSWSPAIKLFDETMKVGDQWTGSSDIQTEDASVIEVLEHKVERFEKIKIKLGEFSTFKINASGSVKATMLKGGEVYKGSLKMTYWVGVVNKRLLILKWEYSNDFRQKFYQELESVQIADN